MIIDINANEPPVDGIQEKQIRYDINLFLGTRNMMKRIIKYFSNKLFMNIKIRKYVL
jgi:hypothetical protein